MSPPLGASLRQLASSAAATCNTAMSMQSADTLAYVISSVIAAHYDTCLYTSEKVVVGKFKYDIVMHNKPPVSILYVLHYLCSFTILRAAVMPGFHYFVAVLPLLFRRSR